MRGHQSPASPEWVSKATEVFTGLKKARCFCLSVLREGGEDQGCGEQEGERAPPPLASSTFPFGQAGGASAHSGWI